MNMTPDEIKARVDQDKREDAEFLSHFSPAVQFSIGWQPSMSRPTIVTYDNMITLLAEIERLKGLLAETTR